MRPSRVCDHGAEIDRLDRLVDDWRAGDTKRVDVAAFQGRKRDGFAQLPPPDLAARACIDRGNIVVLGSDEELARRRSWRPPIERLSIKVARNPWMKARVEMGVAGALPAQGWHDKIAAAVGVAVVGQNGLALRGPADRKPEKQGPEPAPPRAGRVVGVASP
jgi:hypothetical protein